LHLNNNIGAVYHKNNKNNKIKSGKMGKKIKMRLFKIKVR